MKRKLELQPCDCVPPHTVLLQFTSMSAQIHSIRVLTTRHTMISRLVCEFIERNKTKKKIVKFSCMRRKLILTKHEEATYPKTWMLHTQMDMKCHHCNILSY